MTHFKPYPKQITPLKKYGTGELALFHGLWKVRPHVCSNLNCMTNGKRTIIFYFNVSFFAHIFSKNKFPELRLVPENIMILCLQCHFIYDMGTLKQKEVLRFENLPTIEYLKTCIP